MIELAFACWPDLSKEKERTATVAYLRRADAVAGHVEDVVHPSGDPVKAVGISAAAVSGEVVALIYMVPQKHPTPFHPDYVQPMTPKI